MRGSRDQDRAELGCVGIVAKYPGRRLVERGLRIKGVGVARSRRDREVEHLGPLSVRHQVQLVTSSRSASCADFVAAAAFDAWTGSGIGRGSDERRRFGLCACFSCERPYPPWRGAASGRALHALALVSVADRRRDLIGAFMGQVDASIVQLALPTLGRVFDATLDSVSWVALGYLLGVAAFLPIFAQLCQMFGGNCSTSSALWCSPERAHSAALRRISPH